MIGACCFCAKRKRGGSTSFYRWKPTVGAMMQHGTLRACWRFLLPNTGSCAQEEPDIAKAPVFFPDLFAQEYDKVVMEVESLSDVSSTSVPVFEMRCSLPDEKAFPSGYKRAQFL